MLNMCALRVTNCLSDIDTSALGECLEELQGVAGDGGGGSGSSSSSSSSSSSGAQSSPLGREASSAGGGKVEQRRTTNVPASLLVAADSEAVKMDWVHAIGLAARTLRECFQPKHTGPVRAEYI